MTHISRLLERTVLSKLQRTCVCVCPVLAVMHWVGFLLCFTLPGP